MELLNSKMYLVIPWYNIKFPFLFIQKISDFYQVNLFYEIDQMLTC